MCPDRDKWDFEMSVSRKEDKWSLRNSVQKEDKFCPVSGHRDLLNVCMLKFDIFQRKNCVRPLNMTKFSPAAFQRPIKSTFGFNKLSFFRDIWVLIMSSFRDIWDFWACPLFGTRNQDIWDPFKKTMNLVPNLV